MKKFSLIAVLGMMSMIATAAHAGTVATAAPSAAADRAATSNNAPLAMIGVPEPSSIGILAFGTVSLILRRRKSR